MKDGAILPTEVGKGGKEKNEKYDMVLASTPYTDGLNLDALGIQNDKLGRIEIDEHFKTDVPSIYARG